jgi:hypothetical protein
MRNLKVQQQTGLATARVLVLGGDDRQGAAARMQAALGCRELHWERTDTVKRRQVAERVVQHGRWDLVLFLAAFVSHSISNPVVRNCKRAGVAFAFVSHGYGKTAVLAAVARYAPHLVQLGGGR